MSQPTRRVHLYKFHSQKGKMSLFAGFEMPMWYRGIVSEHMTVRKAVGIFDVSHMGRALVTGPEAEAFLNYVTTNDVAALSPLCAHYSLMCNEQGGIIDDFVLSRLEEEKFLMVYNASNRDKDFRWLTVHSRGFDVNVKESSDSIAMCAVQCPKAEETLQKISIEDLSRIERFKCGWTKLAGVDASISRTGYTGEKGYEFYISPDEEGAKLFKKVLQAGKKYGIKPIGLGARDTLRLEKCFALAGNEFEDGRTPLEAGLGWIMHWDHDFIGKEALLKQKEEGYAKLSFLECIDAGIPRHGYRVEKDRNKVGIVTSGTFSPCLKKGIAMAYVKPGYRDVGTLLEISANGKKIRAQVI